MSDPAPPKPRCAAPKCGRAAIAGKIYCYCHAKLIAQKFYRQFIALRDRSK